MPSTSDKQQRFFRLVKAVQDGKVKKKDVSKSVIDAAKGMTKKQVSDFANHVTRKKRVKKLNEDFLNEKIHINPINFDDIDDKFIVIPISFKIYNYMYDNFLSRMVKNNYSGIHTFILTDEQAQKLYDDFLSKNYNSEKFEIYMVTEDNMQFDKIKKDIPNALIDKVSGELILPYLEKLDAYDIKMFFDKHSISEKLNIKPIDLNNDKNIPQIYWILIPTLKRFEDLSKTYRNECSAKDQQGQTYFILNIEQTKQVLSKNYSHEYNIFQLTIFKTSQETTFNEIKTDINNSRNTNDFYENKNYVLYSIFNAREYLDIKNVALIENVNIQNISEKINITPIDLDSLEEQKFFVIYAREWTYNWLNKNYQQQKVIDKHNINRFWILNSQQMTHLCKYMKSLESAHNNPFAYTVFFIDTGNHSISQIKQDIKDVEMTLDSDNYPKLSIPYLEYIKIENVYNYMHD